MPCSFVLKWNFCIAKSSRRITCNHVHREGPVRKALLRNVKCITCGCGWLICLRDVNNSNNKVSDHVVITHVYWIHSNTYDTSYVDQFVLERTRYGVYTHCADQCLKEIVVQMYIDPFINVRTMTEFLYNVLSDRKIIGRHIINNVSIRSRKKNLELDYAKYWYWF